MLCTPFAVAKCRHFSSLGRFHWGPVRPYLLHRFLQNPWEVGCSRGREGKKELGWCQSITVCSVISQGLQRAESWGCWKRACSSWGLLNIRNYCLKRCRCGSLFSPSNRAATAFDSLKLHSAQGPRADNEAGELLILGIENYNAYIVNSTWSLLMIFTINNSSAVWLFMRVFHERKEREADVEKGTWLRFHWGGQW